MERWCLLMSHHKRGSRAETAHAQGAGGKCGRTQLGGDVHAHRPSRRQPHILCQHPSELYRKSTPAQRTIGPMFQWAYCGETVVYTYQRDHKSESSVIFWDVKLEEVRHSRTRQVPSFLPLRAGIHEESASFGGHHCLRPILHNCQQGR
jgi:hypothetical protein